VSPRRQKQVFWVNRNSFNRKRHLDPDCRFLRLAQESLEEMHQNGFYDDYEENEGVPAPTVATRFVAVTPANATELAALEAFTIPCQLCIPGARELASECPVEFEKR
jgi:hypothetical protein